MLDFDVATKPKQKKSKPDPPPPPPAERDPFDLEAARNLLAPYTNEVKRVLAEAEALQIIDDATMQLGLEIAQRSTKTANMLDKKRTDLTEPYRNYTSAINSLFAMCIDPLKEVGKKHINPKAIAYSRKKDLERLEAEKRAQEEARKLQDRLDAESAEKNLPRVEVPTPVLPQKMGPIRTEAGSASIRKDWKAILVDEHKVPREYMTIDWPKVNQAVRGGERNIPGFEIRQVEGMQYR